jgi:hypothetical protein
MSCEYPDTVNRSSVQFTCTDVSSGNSLYVDVRMWWRWWWWWEGWCARVAEEDPKEDPEEDPEEDSDAAEVQTSHSLRMPLDEPATNMLWSARCSQQRPRIESVDSGVAARSAQTTCSSSQYETTPAAPDPPEPDATAEGSTPEEEAEEEEEEEEEEGS